LITPDKQGGLKLTNGKAVNVDVFSSVCYRHAVQQLNICIRQIN